MNPIERAMVLHYRRPRLGTHGGAVPAALGWPPARPDGAVPQGPFCRDLKIL
jgi:hypothetical protein